MVPELGKSTWVWGLHPVCSSRFENDPWDWCVRVKEMGFPEVPALGHGIKHITQGQESLHLHVMAMGWDLEPLESEVLNSLTGCWPSPGLDPNCRLPQSWWSWDTRACSCGLDQQLKWTGLWWRADRGSQSSTGSSPGTNPETRAAATSGRTDKIISFSEKLQHLGNIFHFRNTVYWCVWNRLFLDFSGSCEVLRKACFRLRENWKKEKGTVHIHTVFSIWKSWGFSCLHVWHRKRIGPRFLQDEPGPSLHWSLPPFRLQLLRAPSWLG